MEYLAFNSLGQWEILEKDNSVKPFGQNIYNQTANLGRKATRTGEEHPELGRNVATRQYTSSSYGTAKQQAAAEAKKVKEKSGPVKVYTEEEKKALQEKYSKKPA
jgi:hypothetical protein